jgi:LysR family transcriptional regulator, hydrogen peroxide-inducible genes activator
MNIRQYEYILAVAELKSFGLAADKCFITQSTLSTMVGKFEEEIGIKVFDRTSKPITITKEGEAIIEQLNIIQKEISILKGIAESIKGEITGEIRVGVIPTIAPYLLPIFLNEFTQRYPQVGFTVSEMITEHIIEQLEKRELDIGILAIPLENKNLVELPLYQESFVVYDCSEKHKEEVVNLESIDYSNFWLLKEGHCFHHQVNSICEAHQEACAVPKNFEYKVGSIEGLIRFVRNNKGITLLPYLASLDFTEQEKKHIKSLQKPVPVRSVGLVVHRHFVKKELLDAFRMYIQDKVNPLVKTAEEVQIVKPLGKE